MSSNVKYQLPWLKGPVSGGPRGTFKASSSSEPKGPCKVQPFHLILAGILSGFKSGVEAGEVNR